MLVFFLVCAGVYGCEEDMRAERAGERTGQAAKELEEGAEEAGEGLERGAEAFEKGYREARLASSPAHGPV